MKAHIATWVASVISACLVGGAWVYTHPAPRMVRVDIGSLFDEQKQALADQIKPGMSEQEQKALFMSATAYASQIDEALTILAKECGCAVLNSAAILRLPESPSAGIQDMTARVRELVGRKK